MTVITITVRKMPHFYRYRGEESYDSVSRGTTPGLLSPPVSRRSEAPPPPSASSSMTARVSLLGVDVEMSVPSNDDRKKLNQMFSLLETTIKDLKEENKQLKSEVKMLHEKINNKAAVVTSPQPASTNNNCDDLVKRLETDVSRQVKEVLDKVEAIERDNETAHKNIDDRFDNLKSSLEESEKKTFDKIKSLEESFNSAPATATSSSDSVDQKESVIRPVEDVDDLKLFVLQTVEATKDLVRGPLSVVFDGVRSEDFVGEDNYLTFSKVNIY